MDTLRNGNDKKSGKRRQCSFSDCDGGKESAPIHYRKGSIAIDGVSLTVATVNDRELMVSIIPHTGEETILLKKKAGETVNLECDVIGKYVERLLSFPKKKQVPQRGLAKNFYKKTDFFNRRKTR